MVKIPVVWSAQMVPEGAEFLSSPSASKPNRLVESWLSSGYPIEIHECKPVTDELISLAHDPGFVRSVFAKHRENGFGTFDDNVNLSVRFTVGSFVQAARMAMDGSPVVCSPTSGFHHAMYDECGKYCTFNGLMIAACDLLDSNSERRVLILDMDQHYGDGTTDIISRLGLKSVSCITGFHGDPELIIDGVWSAISIDEPDIVFFQAGVDSHVDDKCHGKFTLDQLYRRDLAVFQACKELEIPVVWNLAGGYQSPDFVDRLHTNTMTACINVFGKKV